MVRTLSTNKHARRPGSRFRRAVMNLVNSTKRLPDCPCRPGASGLTRLKSGQGGAAVITRRSAAPPGTCSTALAAAAGSSSNRLPRWDLLGGSPGHQNGSLVNLPRQNMPDLDPQAEQGQSRRAYAREEVQVNDRRWHRLRWRRPCVGARGRWQPLRAGCHGRAEAGGNGGGGGGGHNTP